MGRASISSWPRQWRKSSPPCKRRSSSSAAKPELTSRLLTRSWRAAAASGLVPAMNCHPTLEANKRRNSGPRTAIPDLSRFGCLLHRDSLQHAHPAALVLIARHYQAQWAMLRIQGLAVFEVFHEHSGAGKIGIEFCQRKCCAIAIGCFRHNDQRHVLAAQLAALRHAGFREKRL